MRVRKFLCVSVSIFTVFTRSCYVFCISHVNDTSPPSPLPRTTLNQEESNVLEIGFGCGYSADRFQELSPRSHTIVEPDRVVLERLRGWAETRKGVRVVEGFWQTALPSLGTYDAIFFDDFPVRACCVWLFFAQEITHRFLSTFLFFGKECLFCEG